MVARHRRSPLRRRPAWLGALALAASTLALAPRAAEAYCRSTTCTDGCARDANDCKTEGHPLYWASMCVGFSLQRDGSVNIPYPEVERVVGESFLAWTDLPCPGGTASLMFARLADVSCDRAEYNSGGANANIIIFQDYRWTYTGQFNTLGKATVTYDNETGEILDADIELNHAFNEFTTGDDYVVYDLQSILTHEVGHLLGLDHTSDFYATMNPGYQQGSIDLRSPEADDIEGVCAAYPPGRDAVCSTSPRGGLGDACGGDPAGADDGEGCSCRLVGASPTATGEAIPWWLVVALGAGSLRRLRVRAALRSRAARARATAAQPAAH